MQRKGKGRGNVIRRGWKVHTCSNVQETISGDQKEDEDSSINFLEHPLSSHKLKN